MSEPFVGEIRMFAGNFAPRGWALCDGQLLAISQNDALFSLFGTIYGGDGRTSFGLPELRGRIPIHQGTGSGLTPRRLGARAGDERVTLTGNQLPAHTHAASCSTGGNSADAAGHVWATDPAGFSAGFNTAADNQMASTKIEAAGGSRSHNNLMPFLCVNFIVALFGIYPSRS